jgi:hypothetical protein
MAARASTDLAREGAAMTRYRPSTRLAAAIGIASLATPIAADAAETTAAVLPPTPAQSASTPADTPVDVVIAPKPTPFRVVSLEFNPLSLIIGKVSFNAVVTPVSHHALILSPFYVSTNTWPIYVFSDQGAAQQVPQQVFSGFGGEIGYRYYTGQHGPRGFFAGPSLIVGAMKAKAQNGSTTDYVDVGGAVDIGYELLVVDAVALSVGAGAQYTAPTKTIPSQQFPADVYANGKLEPRALASIGWAF